MTRLGWIMLVALVALLTWLLVAPSLAGERTQDAYVQGNIVQVTAQVSGTVLSIAGDDTDAVSAGTTVVRLNPVDYEVQLDRAKAALASATRKARMQFHQTAQSEAEVRQRQNDLDRASNDQRRRQQVAESGAVSQEELQHANELVTNARESLEVSRLQLAQRRAMTDGLSLASYPDVIAAASQVRESYVALHRTVIQAPVGGIVSRRTVQVGQHVAPATALMSIVPMDQLWVDANFKESQLEHIRPGQTVTLTTDFLGGKVVLHGRVTGLDAGTGSAFALLPAQNATGNWIKVTQRVPVRIELMPEEVSRYQLRIGMSVHVSVDTRGEKATASMQRRPPASYGTQVFDQEMQEADAAVKSIILENAGEFASSIGSMPQRRD